MINLYSFALFSCLLLLFVNISFQISAVKIEDSKNTSKWVLLIRFLSPCL